MDKKIKEKRKKVQDHKFDYLDVTEFEKESATNRIKYTFVFFSVLKSVLVCLGDLWTAGVLLFNQWPGQIKPKIPIYISKWIFLGSIVLSFILLYIEIRKARKIIASKDISYAFTSNISYRYYTLTSFAHWCFFQEINNSQLTQDKIAFFVFFRFKGWKSLLFADGPRQVINAITLFEVLQENNFSLNASKYAKDIITAFAYGVMAFTVLIFAISLILLGIAFIVYIPLLCKIRGNLKEYCCYRIDKRIDLILRKQRLERIRKTAINQKANNGGRNNIEPTLPVLDDDEYYQPPLRGTKYDDDQPLPPPLISNQNMSTIPPELKLMGQPNYNNDYNNNNINLPPPTHDYLPRNQVIDDNPYQRRGSGSSYNSNHHIQNTNNNNLNKQPTQSLQQMQHLQQSGYYNPTTSPLYHPQIQQKQQQRQQSTQSHLSYPQYSHEQLPHSTLSLQYDSSYATDMPRILSHNNSQNLPSRYYPQNSKGFNNYTSQGGGK